MHVYLVSSGSEVIGIFSNRTILYENLKHIFKDYHIQGARKELEITPASIGSYMAAGFLKLFPNDETSEVIRIWDLNVNSLNPRYKK